MPLSSSRLPAMLDGDRVWFAMLDGAARPVDCYVETEALQRLEDGPGGVLARFDRYRPVFEIMVNDLYRRRQALVLAQGAMSRWEP